MAKKKSKTDEIVAYVCPRCCWWQKWAGNCDSLCEVKTEAKTFRPLDKD